MAHYEEESQVESPLPSFQMEVSGKTDLFLGAPCSSETREMYNNTGKEVWVCGRDGIAQRMRVSTRSMNAFFGMRITRVITDSVDVVFPPDQDRIVKGDVIERPTSDRATIIETYRSARIRVPVGAPHPREVVARQNAIHSAMSNAGYGEFAASYEYLLERGGAFHCKELDVVFATTENGCRFYWNDSEARKRLENSISVLLNREQLPITDFSILLVSNTRDRPDQYVLIHGVVQLVKSLVISDLPDGVYIFAGKELGKDGVTLSRTSKHYSFESCREAGLFLFDTPAAARAHGNVERQAETKATETKIALVEAKLTAEQETIEVKQKATVADIDNAARMKTMADYYDAKSYHRKDNSEEMKYFFAGLLAMLGLLTAFLKSK
jgi:hypothetical protein